MGPASAAPLVNMLIISRHQARFVNFCKRRSNREERHDPCSAAVLMLGSEGGDGSQYLAYRAPAATGSIQPLCRVLGCIWQRARNARAEELQERPESTAQPCSLPRQGQPQDAPAPLLSYPWACPQGRDGMGQGGAGCRPALWPSSFTHSSAAAAAAPSQHVAGVRHHKGNSPPSWVGWEVSLPCLVGIKGNKGSTDALGKLQGSEGCSCALKEATIGRA